jgi:hypothetical protein
VKQGLWRIVGGVKLRIGIIQKGSSICRQHQRDGLLGLCETPTAEIHANNRAAGGSLVAPHISAFGDKADMTFCSASVCF